MLSEEDRAMAIGNMHTKIGEDRTCSSKDMIADGQTRTQTDTLITLLCFPMRSGVISICMGKVAKSRFVSE